MAVLLALVLLVLALALGAAEGALPPTNLFIGTGGGGFGIAHNPPGPQYPFAALRLGPDTSLDRVWIQFNHHSGFYWRDTHIRAFSHTRYVGCGGPDWGNFGVMALDKALTDALVTAYGYRSEFDREEQVAHPGYYAVTLPTHRVFAELTAAGNFTGVHRYTFADAAADAPKTLLVDVCHALSNSDTYCVVGAAAVDVAANRLTASMKLRGGGTGRSPRGGVDVFFCARLGVVEAGREGALPVPPRANATVSAHGVWRNNVVYRNASSASKAEGEPPSLGMFVEFVPAVRAVTVYAGISFISTEQACANLAAELGTRLSFDEVRADAEAVWEAQLLGILESVEARADQGEDDVVEAYTALYRSLQSPTIYTETNGAYRGFDNALRTSAPGTTRFSDLSLWDTFRTQHPLLVLVRPDVALGCVQSLIDMAYEDGGDGSNGDLPRWALANHETGSMLGDSANSVIVDYLRKVGAQGWNTTAAYAKMRIKSLEVRPTPSRRTEVLEYNELGYVAVDTCQRCSSHSLHYHYDDFAIALLAEHLGLAEDAALFHQRALNYSRLFEGTQTFMMQPRRRDGSFVVVPPERMLVSNEFWVEGNTNHWTFFVQHDPLGLIRLYPSVDAFVERLTSVFVAYANAPLLQATNLLPNEGYWGGNEPSLFHAWLFAYAGRPDLTQFWARHLLEDLYRNDPAGLPGNDDFGTLSAWFTFAATLGLYPNPPHTHYVLGSPLFARTSVRLGNGSRLVVVAHDNSRENIYVDRVLWNGAPLASFPFIEHADLVAGGTLEFFMSNEI